MRLELEKLIAENENRVRGAKVLDFGCGDMPYRPLFQEAAAGEYLGADLSEQSKTDIVIEKEGVIQGYDSYFDIVLSIQVLEHVLNPTLYLAECKRLLKKSGLLILSTHGIWPYHPHPHDCWRWTSEGLKKVICDAGFTIVSFRGLLGLTAIATQLWQDAIRHSLPPKLQSLLFLLSQQSIAWQDRFTTQQSKDKDAGIYFLTAIKGDAL